MKMDDFRLTIGKDEYVPIVIGGMGVNISTLELAVVGAEMGGIGHVSDAGSMVLSDKMYGTDYIKQKIKRDKKRTADVTDDLPETKFDLDHVYEGQKRYIEDVVSMKKGAGSIFINTMEKLTMHGAADTLRARLRGTLDAGAEGITLSAGLHLGSFALIQDHPRFRDVKLGIIVSSLRALRIFLRFIGPTERLPDYIIVEGPLAGGHLGFSIEDIKKYELGEIIIEIKQYLDKQDLDIPLIAAGGVFTGTDGVEMLKKGAAAIQVATRFTISKECGFPDKVKQAYFKSQHEDVIVNMTSPTGYPMRMLKQSPSITTNYKPQCASLGYILNDNGECQFKTYHENRNDPNFEGELVVKSCLCSHMITYRCWTCGENVYRLKDTSIKKPNGEYQLLDAAHIYRDYQFSENHEIKLPEPELDAKLS
jgi:nitronate monooxygenase